jgi:type IV secretory pathway VirB4 component
MFLDEAKRVAYGVPDLLLYASLVEDGVMLLQNGAMMATWSFRGPDLASSTHEEMDSISRRLNALLMLGSDWMIHCDAIRTFAQGYPAEGAFPSLATRIIDEERRAQFQRAGSHFNSEYFLSLTYLPPLEKEEKLKGYLFTDPDGKKVGVAERVLNHFKEKVATFDVMLKSIIRADRLGAVIETDEFGNEIYFDDQLRYLRRCVQGDDFKYALPEFPVYLHDTIGAISLDTGVVPLLGNRYLGVVAIDGFPSHSRPGQLSVMDTLPFEYRWSTRAILHDAEKAKPILESRFKKWKGMERGFMDQLLGKVNGRLDLNAVRMSTDGATAISVASGGDVQFCMYSANIVMMHENKDQLAKNQKEVVKLLRSAGFGARIEQLNVMEAWLGSLPGDANHNPRRFYIHTLNFERKSFLANATAYAAAADGEFYGVNAVWSEPACAGFGSYDDPGAVRFG